MVMVLIILILPLWFLRGDSGSSSADPQLQELIVKPRPAAGGMEATFSPGLLAGKWNRATPLAGRLQAIRGVCASLPVLEEEPIGRMRIGDARAIAELLDTLPFDDVGSRIDWAKPLVGNSTHMQESLISGGQNFGLFVCVDELAAATAWSLAPERGWTSSLEDCARRGGACPSQLYRRLAICQGKVQDCARQMRFREITELKQAFGLGGDGPPTAAAMQLMPMTGQQAAPLLEAIERAKLEQNPG
jgi:hypothetical protein